MRIFEILLPKGISDKSLSKQTVNKIDALQQRMNSYVDKILDPGTSVAGKEFLKSKLRDDFYELKGLIKPLHKVAENADDSIKYEVYDTRTGEKVSGPYSNKSRARMAADKKDIIHGSYRYNCRPIKQTKISEAIRKLPLTNEDFELVKEVMNKPIPAVIAPIYIMEIIDDDELNSQLLSLEETDPGRDVRPLIAEWFSRVMPDQMHRFGQEVASEKQKLGLVSPIHGYDPKMFKGGTDTGTSAASNNAYGYS